MEFDQNKIDNQTQNPAHTETNLLVNEFPAYPPVAQKPKIDLKRKLLPRQVGYTVAGMLSLALLAVAGNFWFQGYNSSQQASNTLQIGDLNNKIAKLQGQVKSVSTEQDLNTESLKELSSKSGATARSQDDLLTTAVAKVTPAVVSIVISKDVPKLVVVYKNPFGDDPYFKDFNVRVPVYQQKGVERQKIGAGTGFIISNDGYIITNRHVVYDPQAIYTVLMANGTQKNAAVVYRDNANDIAIIKIGGSGYTKVTLGDSSALKLGQSVVAIGNALGEYNNSASTGIISGLNRTLIASGNGGTEKLSGVIQTDAGINPGNSGGPLINLNGQVVGVNVATAAGANSISFSIPVNDVKNIIKLVLPK